MLSIDDLQEVVHRLFKEPYRFCFPEHRHVRSLMQGRDLRTFCHTAIHVGQGVSTGWAKNLKKFRIFEHFEIYVIIHEQQLQLEASDPSQEKILIPPLSTCRIYIGVSPTAFYRLGQKIDTISILRITAIAPEPTTVSVCSERRQVRLIMQCTDMRTLRHIAFQVGQAVFTRRIKKIQDIYIFSDHAWFRAEVVYPSKDGHPPRH